MNVNLSLIILHLDLQTLSNGCLLDGGQVISRSLSTNDVGGELRSILSDYLEIRPDWVRFNLVDVIPTMSDLSVVYTCLIPSIIKSKKGQWTQLGEIDDKNIKKLVFQASQKTT